jgi:NADPH:quinone reductase-like Zn-dependent oxidoreductase
VVVRNPVLVIPVVNVRDALEPCRWTLPNVSLANVSLSPRVGATRHQQFAVIGKETDHRIRIVCVGCGKKLLERLGGYNIDEPINYEKTRFEEVVHNVDVVLDPIGGETQQRSWKVLKKGGILVSIVVPPSTEEANKHGVRSAFISASADTSVLGEIAKLIDSGKLKPIVETVLLSEARKAHERNESGHARG